MCQSENDGCHQEYQSCAQSNKEVRWLDFRGIDSVVHRRAVHDQYKQAQQEGAAADELKEVESPTQGALRDHLLTDEGQERQHQLQQFESPEPREPAQGEVGGEAAPGASARARVRLGGGSVDLPVLHRPEPGNARPRDRKSVV